MKKIMFNDKFGLTEAVLNGKKTMTRRLCKYDIPNEIMKLYFQFLSQKSMMTTVI